MVRTDPVTRNIVTAERSAFRSLQEPFYDSTDLEAAYERMVAKMLESFSAFLMSGSGWTLKRIIKLDITPAKNKPLKGSSKILLPVGLTGGKKLINMNNEDDYCFMYAATRALNMVKKDPQRITPELREQAEELNWEDIEFPTPCSERRKRE